MKINKLQRFKTLMVVLLACVLTSVVMIVGNTTKSYADENFDEQGWNYQEQELSNDSESNDDWYEDECENDFLQNHLKVHNPEEESKNHYKNFAVSNGQFNVVYKNMFNKDGSFNSEFVFKYNYRGWYGDKKNNPYRKANVQYFYNSETKELVLLAFGGEWNDNRYKVMRYHSGTRDTALEDVQEFNHANNNKISSEVEYVFIDPEISLLGSYSLEYLSELKTIDICNHLYSASRIGDNPDFPGIDGLDSVCLYQDGARYVDIWEYDHRVNVPFIKLFSPHNIDDFMVHYNDRYGLPLYPIFETKKDYGYISVKHDNNIAVQCKNLDYTDLQNNQTYQIEYSNDDPEGEAVLNIQNSDENTYDIIDNNKLIDRIYPRKSDSINLYTRDVPIHQIEIVKKRDDIRDVSGHLRYILGEDSPFAKVDFISDDGQRVYHGNVFEYGYFEITIPNGEKGKIQASCKGMVGHSDEMTVTSDLEDIDIYLDYYQLSGHCYFDSPMGKGQLAQGVFIEILDKDGNRISEAISDKNGYYNIEIKKGTQFKISSLYCRKRVTTEEMMMCSPITKDFKFTV